MVARIRGSSDWRKDRSGNCQICGIWRKVLQRDRIIPKREGGTYAPENVQWICANCHQDKTSLEQSAAHKGRPKPPEQIAKMSAWQIGKVYSRKTRERISKGVTEAMKNPALREILRRKALERYAENGAYWTDKHHSEKTKTKISVALKKHYAEKKKKKKESL